MELAILIFFLAILAGAAFLAVLLILYRVLRKKRK